MGMPDMHDIVDAVLSPPTPGEMGDDQARAFVKTGETMMAEAAPGHPLVTIGTVLKMLGEEVLARPAIKWHDRCHEATLLRMLREALGFDVTEAAQVFAVSVDEMKRIELGEMPARHRFIHSVSLLLDHHQRFKR